jgi:hypothetical protein
MNWLPTHLLLQLLRKVFGEGSISGTPIGKLNLNHSLCLVVFLTSPVIQGPTGYLSDSSAKAPETSAEIPSVEDTLTLRLLR